MKVFVKVLFYSFLLFLFFSFPIQQYAASACTGTSFSDPGKRNDPTTLYYVCEDTASCPQYSPYGFTHNTAGDASCKNNLNGAHPFCCTNPKLTAGNVGTCVQDGKGLCDSAQDCKNENTGSQKFAVNKNYSCASTTTPYCCIPTAQDCSSAGNGATCGAKNDCSDVGSKYTLDSTYSCTDQTKPYCCKPPAAIPLSPPPPPCATEIGGANGNNGCASVDTAFGVWDTTPQGFVKSLFGILLSISGTIAVLIIIFAGYKMIMSQGDPEKIQAAREQLTAAIIGLLFLIFSLVILQVIGVDILHLPGFSGTNNTSSGSGSSGAGSGGGTPTPNPALDATACQNIQQSNLQCGFNGSGTGFFCGNSGNLTNCGVTGNVGTLYKCDSSGKMVSFERCKYNACIQDNGAPNADFCDPNPVIKHYACQKNGLCKEDPNGIFTSGNCNNACN